METIVTVISFLIFGLLLLSPVILVRIIKKTTIKQKFIVYLIFGILTTACISLVFAWWGDESDKILLKDYGYYVDDESGMEIFENVKPENIERVKSLKTSIMGIGWPLRAILSYVFVFPYLIIVYVASYLIGNRIKKSSQL